MTDTKLIERLRTDAIFDTTTLGNEAADAIEALQAECAEHKENAMRNARIAVSIRAERDQLQSKLGDAIQSSAHWQHQFTEAQAENERLMAERKALSDSAKEVVRLRDALQSKLDAMGKGEPVAYSVGNTLKWHEGKGMTNTQLYAAPKALAPRFTECRIELVGAIHTLASHYENRLGRLNPEDRKLAEGDIAHAMATAAKWNWNGNGIGGTP